MYKKGLKNTLQEQVLSLASPTQTHLPTMADEEKPQQTRFEAGNEIGTEKSSTGYANSETGLAHVEEFYKEERRIVRKLDRIIVPLTALLYLSAYLDRYVLVFALRVCIKFGP